MTTRPHDLATVEDHRAGGAPDLLRGMLFVPGGMFAMGSDTHYPEEAPVHRVTVDGFWIDGTPVTNRQFRTFVDATSYVTFAEIAPAEDYPGALPRMLKAGSLVFRPPPSPVDLSDWSQWWEFRFGAKPAAFRRTRAGRARIKATTRASGSHLCAPNYCRRYRPAARHLSILRRATLGSDASCEQENEMK